MYQNNRGASLCWFCERCISKCEWSKDFEEVKGWYADAEKNKDGTIKRAWVGWCPKFKPENGFEKRILKGSPGVVRYVGSPVRYATLRYHIKRKEL